MTRFRWTAGFVLVLGAVMPLAGQTRPQQVTIALAEEYPAFGASQGSAGRARPVGAIAIRRNPSGQPVILLNPRYANVQTLAAAVRALEVCPATRNGSVASGFVAISPRAGESSARAGNESRLATWLREVGNEPVTNLRSVGAERARSITVSGITVCSRA